MATTPQPKPQTPPPHPPAPPQPKPAGGHSLPPIGAKPTDPKDPQAAKFEAQKVPPRWDEPKKDVTPRVEWNPKPSLDPRDEVPKPSPYVDGMPIAEEQRLRSAAIEQMGMSEYVDYIDDRPDEEKAKPKQVQGVAPPTKRA